MVLHDAQFDEERGERETFTDGGRPTEVNERVLDDLPGQTLRVG